MSYTHQFKLTRGKDFVGVGVGGVIVKGDRILLLLRKKPPESQHWTIPGGAVEFGEKVEDALTREIMEEIGVHARIVAPLGVTDQILPTEGTHWVSIRFLVDIGVDQPWNACPESHLNMDWFPLDRLPQNITLTAREGVIAYLGWLSTSGGRQRDCTFP